MNPYRRRHAADDNGLLGYARREMKAIGLDDGDPMNTAAMDAVLELLHTFSRQGHSGFSANYVLNVFNKLAQHQPLGPLTGEDHEWTEVSSTDHEQMWQNNRAFGVFKSLDKATGTVKCYYIDGVVFEEPDGVRYTNSESHVPVEFPYTPTTEIRTVPKSARTAGVHPLDVTHRLFYASLALPITRLRSA